MEEAQGYALLMEAFDLTQEATALRVGKSRAAVANAVRLLNLPEPLQTHLRQGRLSVGHAKVILGLGGGPTTNIGGQTGDQGILECPGNRGVNRQTSRRIDRQDLDPAQPANPWSSRDFPRKPAQGKTRHQGQPHLSRGQGRVDYQIFF